MPLPRSSLDGLRRRRLLLRLGCGVSVALAMSACSERSAPPTPEPSTATESVVLPLEAIDCELGRDPVQTRAREVQGLALQRDLATQAGEDTPRGRQVLPADFEPVAAVLCVEVAQSESGQVAYEQWLADVALQDLVDVLRRGDATGTSPGCDGYYDPQPNLWLISEDGSAVAPRWPLDECGHLRAPAPEVVIPDSSLIDSAGGMFSSGES